MRILQAYARDEIQTQIQIIHLSMIVHAPPAVPTVLVEEIKQRAKTDPACSGSNATVLLQKLLYAF